MIHSTLINKLTKLSQRHEELTTLLAQEDVTKDLNRYRSLNQEYAEIKDINEEWLQYQSILKQMEETAALDTNDSDMKELVKSEQADLLQQQEEKELILKKLLLPKDSKDNYNIFLEVRMGTGGNEAALFAGDLQRMYTRFCEREGFTIEILSQSQGEHGGYREIISRIIGKGAFSKLKFESGGHRVQRVPTTEAQGRIHTSAATVAILPELKAMEDVEVNPSDIRIDTYRASGAGGQHVNKTDSAVRITHTPTNIVVECQNERSQHKNKSRAMSLLASRLYQLQMEERQSTQAETRRLLIGSGDRSMRIRTYNFPQGRVTDHRINLTLYKIAQIMDGDLQELLNPLTSSFENQELEQLLDELNKV